MQLVQTQINKHVILVVALYNMQEMRQHHYLQCFNQNMVDNRSDKQTVEILSSKTELWRKASVCDEPGSPGYEYEERINPLGLGAIQFFPSVVHSKAANL